jgi:uncharacterized repeat protein (TIGR03803 family)
MKRRFAVPTIILVMGLGLFLAGQAMAQTFTVLHRFTASGTTNNGGYYPLGRLAADSSGNILYGTLNLGGSGYFGTVYAIHTDGTGFTNLHNFVTYTNGTQPLAGVILSSNRLYGTAWRGGVAGNGAVFAVNTDGSGFTNLHHFTATVGSDPFSTNSDGARSRAGLILAGNRLYGTAEYGGSAGGGTVFALNTDGTGFTTVHSFPAGAAESIFGNYTNVGGIWPNGGVVLSGNTLYGTAVGGGRFARGTVFKVNTDGSGFTTLHNFTRADYHPVLNPLSANSDGTHPVAPLILSGDTLYGTAEAGGYFGQGTVFKINTNGTGFTTLHSFFHTSDGYYANAGLFLSGNTLYGAAIGGGMHGNGTIFALNTDGTGFTNLHNFIADNDGSEPDALVLLGNALYGVARQYGTPPPEYSDNGTVFRLSFAPHLTINRSETNVVLTWPTHIAGFDYAGHTLQSTTNLDSSAVWTTNSPAPTVVNGQNTVTNPASEPQRFFRLKSN